MSSVVISVDGDAAPVARGLAGRLRRSASMPKLARRMAKMDGVLVLRSPVDSQAATIRFRRGDVRVSSGVSADADVTITLDFDDAAAKPKVEGAARHPLLALGASKVLEPPIGTWQQEAEAFWTFARDTPRMPASLLVVCTDEGASVQFGEDGPPVYEIHGPAAALVASFSGGSIFGQDILDGKLLCVGTFEHASVLTGRSIAWAMGEGR